MLALAGSAESDEKASILSDNLLYSATKELAVEMAASVDKVTMGTTVPSELVVPVIVVSLGPFGPVVVIAVVIIGGKGNCDDGKISLLVDENMGGIMVLEFGGNGGRDGYSIGGNPLRLV